MKRIEPPLRIASPCSMDWHAMSGDERKRFCAGCGKHVFNLSAMTGPEAEAFAGETQGRECIAYIEAGDGKIHSPGRVERFLMRLANRRPRWATALAMVLPAALTACTKLKLTTSGVPSGPSDSDSRQMREGNDGQMTLGEPSATQPEMPSPMTMGMPAAPKSADPPAKADH